MYPELSMMIDGEAVTASGRRREPVVNPATGQTLDLLPYATAADLDRALESAQRAFADWKEVPARSRAAILKRGAELMRSGIEGMQAYLDVKFIAHVGTP